MPWVNRPTYQLAIEITGHRPRPGAPTPAPKTACGSRRTVLVSLPRTRGARILRISVSLNGRRVRTVFASHGRLRIDLRGRPRTAVRVVIRVATDHGVITVRRTFHTCVPGRHPRRPRHGG